jgi:hypothetical protein
MNNQPAFPRPFSADETTSCFPSNQLYPAYSGMTLRDYFAAKAMQGLIGRSWEEVSADELFSIWSNSAYAIADAMLRARER